MAQRVVTIFLSTPSDVTEEQRAVSSLVSEINEVVQFLAPERDLRLELIHYETHTFPDMAGGPQSTISKQLPEYDIHCGVMWKRCGTPTAHADSGTVEEFDIALKRREKTGRPTIMFYFGAEGIDFPESEEEVEQLKKVIKFKRRLEAIGLTATYPRRAEFRERARRGLLRAVADILREEIPQPQEHANSTNGEDIPPALSSLSFEYDRVRGEMDAGPERTRVMTQILEEMKVLAPDVRDVLPRLLEHPSAGHRLAAIGILQVFPTRAQIGWLADRLDPDVETPFVGYQAAMALLQSVRSLPRSDCELLRKEVHRARELAARNPHDPPRISALDYTLKELRVKCG